MMKIQTKHYFSVANVSIQVFLVVNVIATMVTKGSYYVGPVILLMLYQFVTALIGAGLQNKWRIDSIAIWFIMLMGGVLIPLLVGLVGSVITDNSDIVGGVMENLIAFAYYSLFAIIAPLVYFTYSIRELAYFHKHPDRIQEGNRELFEDILDADDI